MTEILWEKLWFDASRGPYLIFLLTTSFFVACRSIKEKIATQSPLYEAPGNQELLAKTGFV
jgi:hypothetical protein